MFYCRGKSCFLREIDEALEEAEAETDSLPLEDEDEDDGDDDDGDDDSEVEEDVDWEETFSTVRVGRRLKILSGQELDVRKIIAANKLFSKEQDFLEVLQRLEISKYFGKERRAAKNKDPKAAQIFPNPLDGFKLNCRMR
jgi:hypothetical protein